MPDSQEYRIDVGEIFRNKFGEKTPKWLIRLGRKLLHEDFLNEIFEQGYTGVEFADFALKSMNVTLQVEGLEKVPTDRLVTVASNHPLGGDDALAVVSIFGRIYDGNIRIMVNDFLMALKMLNGIFVPVNKVGGQSRNLATQTDAIFHSDHQVIMFPAGKCARRVKGRIQELPWKKTFLTKSVETHRDIVPMHFYGRNSWRFYFVDWIGDMTGINKKFPLAMALLVDEMYRAQGKTFRIVIGDPIPWQTFDDSKKPAEWADWVKQRVEEL
jgi:putative hemolysin